MSFAAYMKSRLGELVLTLVSAASMAQVAFNAFYIDEATQNSPLGWIVIFVLIVMLHTISYKKSWFFGGTACVVVMAVVIVAVGVASSTNEGGAYIDTEGSYLFYALVLLFSPIICYVLTRGLTGSAIWFVGTAFFCVAVQAFYGFDEYLFSACTSVSALMLVIYRNFMLGMAHAQTIAQTSHLSAFLSSIAPVLLAFFAAGFVWVAIIAPLNPSVLELKLITEYRKLPIEQLQGTASVNPQFDTSITSQNLTDGERYTTDDLKLDNSSDDTVEAKSTNAFAQNSSGSNDTNSGSSGSQSTLSYDSDTQKYDAQSYSVDFPAIVFVLTVLLLLIALIVAYFVLRRRLRLMRLARMLDAPVARQLENIYRFCLERMRRIGFKLPEGVTLNEFAHYNERRFDTFTKESGVSFVALTDAYTGCVYGRAQPSEDEVVLAVAFYEGFWRAARSYLGDLRYFWRSFVL